MKRFISALFVITITGASASAQDDYKYQIHFKNGCGEKLQTAIRYKSTSGDWVSGGFWRLERGEESFVAKTNNRVIYVHYANMDGNHFGGGYKKVVRGKTLDFNKHTFAKPTKPRYPFKLHLELECRY